MNSVMRVIVVVLMSCTSHFLYRAADKPDKPLNPTELILRHLVFTEPHAEHANPHAWIIDSTKTAAAIACVNKKWNTYITKPRKELMQAHQQNFDAVHLSSLLFNRYAQFCCLVSKDQHIKALFGVVGSQPSVFTIRPWLSNRDRSSSPYPEHIFSTTITYYNEQQQKKQISAFQCIVNTHPAHPHQICILLPEEKQQYRLHLTPNSYELTSCTPTLNKIIAATFELSEDPNFWNYHFSNNGVEVKREVATADITIDLKNEYFNKAYANISKLDSIEKSFREDPCSCGTNHIDPACKENYETVCKILEEEGATHLKGFFLTFFFHQHILHDVGYIKIENHTATIYTNPCGAIIVYKPYSSNKYTCMKTIYSSIPTMSLDSLRSAAANHASKWRTMGNLLLRNNTKKIDYYSYDTLGYEFLSNHLTLKDNEEVIDGMRLTYKNNPVPIFVLQMASKKTKLLFGSDASDVYPNGAKDQNALKKGLARILFERKPYSYTVMVPEQEIAPFMHFVKKLESPIKDLKNIYPAFDYHVPSSYDPFSF